jgi:outer membrane PBP1 activator LpoA protein
MKQKLLTRIAAPAAVSSCSTFTPSTSYKKCTKQPPQLSEQKELVWMLKKSASNIQKSMWDH